MAGGPPDRLGARGGRPLTGRATWLRVPGEAELPPEMLELWEPSLEKLGFVPNVLRFYALAAEPAARLERPLRRGDEG